MPKGLRFSEINEFRDSLSTVNCVVNEVLNDPFYSPSFEWEEVPVVFMGTNSTSCTSGTVLGYSDGTFALNNLRLDYLRHPLRISWASGITGGYTYPNGNPAAGLQNCELAEHTHHEIVDIAVMIASGDLDHPNFQMKMLKTQLNE